MKVRARTFESWFKANFTKGEMKDIAQHGANMGYHHITYYTDTVKLYDRFADDIWNTLYDMSERQGSTVPALIATFNCAEQIVSNDTFKNAMVWFMCEELAYRLTGE